MKCTSFTARSRTTSTRLWESLTSNSSRFARICSKDDCAPLTPEQIDAAMVLNGKERVMKIDFLPHCCVPLLRRLAHSSSTRMPVSFLSSSGSVSRAFSSSDK